MKQSSDLDGSNCSERYKNQFLDFDAYDEHFDICKNYQNHFYDQSSRIPQANLQVYPQAQQINLTKQVNNIIPKFIQTKYKGLFTLKPKVILMIDTCIDQKYLGVKSVDHSKKLYEYLKAKIKQFLKTQITTYRLETLDRQKIQRYFSKNQSFASMKILFGIPDEQIIHEDEQCDKIRKQCYKYFSSINFLKVVMMAKNKFMHKITVIKYLHRMPMIIVEPHKYNNWKQK